MEVAARLKGARISAQKARLVADQVRGKGVEEVPASMGPTARTGSLPGRCDLIVSGVLIDLQRPGRVVEDTFGGITGAGGAVGEEHDIACDKGPDPAGAAAALALDLQARLIGVDMAAKTDQVGQAVVEGA